LPGKSRKVKLRQGDVFGIYFSHEKCIAHCGFLESADGIWVITTEGNTNASGSREGEGVYRKRRLLTSLYKVANWTDGN
jgi:hypothetical protein